MGEFLSLLWKPSHMLPWSHLEVGMTTHVSENWWGNGKSEHLNQLFCCSCCSVAKSCPTLCDPMNCSTPASSVLHHLPEFAQIYVHWVADAIQPSHPLSALSPAAFNLSQHQGLFQWVSSSHQVGQSVRTSASASSLPMNTGLISFRIN